MTIRLTGKTGLGVLAAAVLLAAATLQAATENENDASVFPEKTRYLAGETIIVTFNSFPGNSGDWVTLAGKGAPDSSVTAVCYTLKKKSGQFSFQGLPPGNYEVRGYADWPRGGYTVIARKPFSVIPAPAGGGGIFPMRLSLNNTHFAPDEEIFVAFIASPSFRQDAWVGIVPSSVPHINEEENDRHDIAFQHLSGRQEGILLFRAPREPGIYDFRMHNTDSGGEELAFVSFVVTPDAGEPLISSPAVLETNKEIYNPDEKIVVDFSGFSGSRTDWITVVKASTPENRFDEWFYTEGKKHGTLTFRGLKSGRYEVRGYFNWSSGGYAVRARKAFLVD